MNQRLSNPLLLAILPLLAFGWSHHVHAQLDVSQGLSVEEYVNEVLLGEGVTAFNVSYIGGMDQLGQLVNGSDSDGAQHRLLVLLTWTNVARGEF